MEWLDCSLPGSLKGSHVLCLNYGESAGLQIAWQLNCGVEARWRGGGDGRRWMAGFLYWGLRNGKEIHGGGGGVKEASGAPTLNAEPACRRAWEVPAQITKRHHPSGL